MAASPSIPAGTLPSLEGLAESDWVYYGLCGLGFALTGLIVGYFIWRKAYMQTIDAETEVRRVGEELERLREDLRLEEESLRVGE